MAAFACGAYRFEPGELLIIFHNLFMAPGAFDPLVGAFQFERCLIVIESIGEPVLGAVATRAIGSRYSPACHRR